MDQYSEPSSQDRRDRLPPAEPERSDEGAPGDDVTELRADIERTRAEIGETVEAIQERLSPPNIAQEARDAAAERVSRLTTRASDTTARASRGLAELIGDYPVATLAIVVVAAVATWLVVGRVRSAGEARGRVLGSDALGEAIESARERVMDAADRMQGIGGATGR